jgi:type II secretory pathway predicted ATPase ExeA
MYRSHFGLNQSPFGITPNPAFFYPGSKRGDILEALIYAVTHGEGIIKVTGEVGSGKTMLCRMLESMLPASVEVIYLDNPSLSREEVIYAIAGELGLAIDGKRPNEVIRLLHKDLIAKHIMGKQVVLLVEEAQAMPLDTLEEIRLFSNLETAHHKLLQIVLFGQPELDQNLSLPSMRQLKERITHGFNVPPLTAPMILEYLMFRMRAAGYRGPDIFSKSAVARIAAVSEGIIRRVSILADKSLLAAFSDNAHTIETKHVKAAIADSEFPNKSVLAPYRNTAIAVALTAVVVIAADVGWRTFGPASGPIEKIARPKAAAGAIAAAPASAPPASSRPPPPAAPASAAASKALPAQPTPAAAAVTVTSARETSTTAAPATTTTPAVKQAAVVASAAPIAAAALTPPATAASGKPATPAASTPPPAAPPAPATSGILQKRLAVSRAWLQKEAGEHYCIQITLVSAANLQKIEPLLLQIQADVDLQQVYLYPSRIGATHRIGVIYGGFATRAEAQRKLAELSKKWPDRPLLRTIQGIRSEIKNTRSEDSWPQ